MLVSEDKEPLSQVAAGVFDISVAGEANSRQMLHPEVDHNIQYTPSGTVFAAKLGYVGSGDHNPRQGNGQRPTESKGAMCGIPGIPACSLAGAQLCLGCLFARQKSIDSNPITK